MKKFIIALGLIVSFSSYAGDERIDGLCKGKDIKDPSICAEVIAEQFDAAYAWGEENAHLIKRQKQAKREEFANSEPMLHLCSVAPDKARCERLRGYLMEEFDAGIGL